jgi:hypothetical protein
LRLGIALNFHQRGKLVHQFPVLDNGLLQLRNRSAKHCRTVLIKKAFLRGDEYVFYYSF